MFGVEKKLSPKKLYGAMVGMFERYSNRFDLVHLVKEKTSQLPELGRVYFDKQIKRYVYIHYPGIDKSKNDQKNPTPTLRQIDAASKEEIVRFREDGQSTSLYLYPAALSNLGKKHFILGWKNGAEAVIEDSKSNVSKIYPLGEVKKLFNQSKTIYRNWQEGDWECGYYVFAAVKRLVFQIDEQEPSIDEGLFDEMSANFKVAFPQEIASIDVPLSSEDDFSMDDEEDFANSSFLSNASKLLKVLNSARERSQRTIDYLDKKNGVSPTFMDLTKANKRNISEKKIQAIAKIIEYIKANVENQEQLVEFTKNLIDGNIKDIPYDDKKEENPAKILLQKRGFLRATILKELKAIEYAQPAQPLSDSVIIPG